MHCQSIVCQNSIARILYAKIPLLEFHMLIVLYAEIPIAKIQESPNRPLVCCPVYSFSNCTGFSNFIFAIKQGGLDKTFDV